MPLTILSFLARLFAPSIAFTEGHYFCEECASVFDDVGDHECIFTGFCLSCNSRQELDDDSCSICRKTNVVLKKRGH